MKHKILITDILFPTKYSKWRIEDIKSLNDQYQADILVVYKLNINEKIMFDIDYEEMKDYYNLQDYNILIFNPIFNYLNKYNTRVDGTSFNNKFPGNYLFTKNTSFDLYNYDLVYHIFLFNYQIFNQNYIFPHNKQMIRLYPGGGFNNAHDLKILNESSNVISTHKITSSYLNDNNHKNYIEILGGPFLPNNYIPNIKTVNQDKITVCFSSIGNPIAKGEPKYVEVVQEYIKKYPNDNIQFITVGNCGEYENIKKYNPMSQKELDNFYFNNVDIIINLENGTYFNGWPLGVEALIQGVVLITTDVKNSNAHFNYPKDSLFIVDPENTNLIIDHIKGLYENRIKLNNMSKVSQSFVLEKYSYTNQEIPAFNYINGVISCLK